MQNAKGIRSLQLAFTENGCACSLLVLIFASSFLHPCSRFRQNNSLFDQQSICCMYRLHVSWYTVEVMMATKSHDFVNAVKEDFDAERCKKGCKGKHDLRITEYSLHLMHSLFCLREDGHRPFRCCIINRKSSLRVQKDVNAKRMSLWSIFVTIRFTGCSKDIMQVEQHLSSKWSSKQHHETENETWRTN